MGAEKKLENELQDNQTGQESGINYELLEKQRTAILQGQLKDRLKAEFGSGRNSFQRSILKSVVMGDYEKANKSIDDFIIYKESYPDFRPRVEEMVRHSRELINAIRSKRNLPGLATLSMAKQKEIMDHVVNHFNELKFSLKQIEKVSKDVALGDIRSTVLLIKTLCYTVLAICVTMFMMSFPYEIGQPFWIVFNDFGDRTFELIYGFLGL